MNLNIISATYMKIIGAAVAATVVVIGSLVALVLTGIIPNPIMGLFLDEPEHSARYYPRDTLAYGWITMYPERGQRDQMLDLWHRFNQLPWIEDQIDELLEDFEEESGLIVEEDIVPWLGPEISVGLLEERGSPVGVLTISVRDSSAAEDFLRDWIDYLEDEKGLEFEFDKKDTVLIWLDESNEIAFALADDVLLTLTAEEPEKPLDELLELIAGEEDRTLADEEDFQAARSQLSGRRFASVFLNVEDSIDALESSDLFSSDFDEVSSLADSDDIPAWVAASAQWIDRGIVVEALAPNTEAYAQDVQDLGNPAELVPSETIGLLAATFNPNLDAWREHLDNYGSDEEISYEIKSVYEDLYWNLQQQSERSSRRKEDPDLADVLDVALELVDAHTGVDLERDLMDHLEGTMVIAVDDVDPITIQDNPADETVNAVAILSYLPGNEGPLIDTLEELSDFLQDDMDLDVDSVNVGADNDAEIFQPDSDRIDTDYSPGYVFHDNHLLFGTTEDALEDAVATQNGNLDDLSSNKEYQRAVEVLPRERQGLLWISLQQLVGHIDAEDTSMTDNEFEVLQVTAGSIAASANADQEYIRVSIAATLFPE